MFDSQAFRPASASGTQPQASAVDGMGNAGTVVPICLARSPLAIHPHLRHRHRAMPRCARVASRRQHRRLRRASSLRAHTCRLPAPIPSSPSGRPKPPPPREPVGGNVVPSVHRSRRRLSLRPGTCRRMRASTRASMRTTSRNSAVQNRRSRQQRSRADVPCRPTPSHAVPCRPVPWRNTLAAPPRRVSAQRIDVQSKPERSVRTRFLERARTWHAFCQSARMDGWVRRHSGHAVLRGRRRFPSACRSRRRTRSGWWRRPSRCTCSRRRSPMVR